MPLTEIFDTTGLLNFVVEIGAAMFAGLLMGLEREFKGKNAGLKTNMLVAIGSAIFVAASMEFRGENNVDITRVLSQVIIGVGFLGGGAILQKSDKIEGLTTAATIWCSAAAGCLAALRMFAELTFIALLVVLVNVIFDYVDSQIGKNKDE